MFNIKKSKKFIEELGKLAYKEDFQETKKIHILRLIGHSTIAILLFSFLLINIKPLNKIIINNKLLILICFLILLFFLFSLNILINSKILKNKITKRIENLKNDEEKFREIFKFNGYFYIIYTFLSVLIYMILLILITSWLIKLFPLDIIKFIDNNSFLSFIIILSLIILIFSILILKEKELRSVSDETEDISNLKHKVQFLFFGILETTILWVNIIPLIIYRA